ncbi:MAG TPA: hypothetical protein VFA18_15010 [Gemmataceae bacterium]|nr:hypothetical protein [Gemmataceae bacterium]
MIASSTVPIQVTPDAGARIGETTGPAIPVARAARCGFPCLVLLLILGCTSKPPENSGANTVSFDQVQAQKDCRARAKELATAVVERNHARVADLTLPTVVERLGGRAQFIRKLEEMDESMKRDGFRMTKCTVGKLTQMTASGGAIYAIVPERVELTGPGGAIERKSAYLIGVSLNNGTNWSFVDGSSFHGNRNVVKQVLPGFPDQLNLPADEPTTTD